MNRYSLTLVLVAAALSVPASGSAQSTDTAHVAPVITTATRIPRSAHDVPASVTLITGAQLRALGITTVADALAGTPSAIITQTGSAGGLTALFLRGGESGYVKVLVDGVAVNDPGGAFDFSTLTTDNIDHIEILRGPASVLYGADAVSGVISIVTRGGATPQRLTVDARGGTYRSGDASATLRGGLPLIGGASADYSLSVARHQTAGLYAFNNQFAESVVSGRADFAPDPRNHVALTLRYTDSRYHYPTNSAGDVVDHNAFDAGDRAILGADYDRVMSRVASLHVSLSSDETSGGTTDQPDTTGGDQYLSLDDVRRHGVDARVDLRDPHGRGVLTVGTALSAADENSQSQGVASGFAYTSAFAAARRNQAAYAQALWTGVPGVTAVAGARVDDNQAFGAFGTYRGGVN
ncbi:MAG: TonB-dependent receptor plug domain-containing protein, partial [Gemmatimonadaceae bacterium]